MLGFGDPFVILTSLDGIEMDASIEEEHRLDSIVTRNPVEDGSMYSDHIVLLPVTLELLCRVSDTSLSYFSPANSGRAIEIYQKLVALKNDRKPFDVVTGINVYKNMIIESMSVPRNSKDGHSIRFNMKITELPIVGIKANSNRDLIAKSVRHTAQGTVNLGPVQKILVK